MPPDQTTKAAVRIRDKFERPFCGQKPRLFTWRCSFS